MLKKDIKKGMLVWWKDWTYGYRDTRDWSIPCLVVKVNQKNITLLTFDDFKEVTRDFNYNERKNEKLHDNLTPISWADVDRYFEDKRDKFDMKKLKLEQDYKKAMREHEREVERFENRLEVIRKQVKDA
jgi:hypothetical protein